jgi:hypothetical protein
VPVRHGLDGPPRVAQHHGVGHGFGREVVRAQGVEAEQVAGSRNSAMCRRPVLVEPTVRTLPDTNAVAALAGSPAP